MKFSEYNSLNKGQSDLDFVDIFLDKDIKLFIDPWAIRESSGPFSIECISCIDHFFRLLIKRISSGEDDEAINMLGFSHEVKEIHFGNSVNSYHGLGMSKKQTNEIFEALSNSKAVETGAIKDLEDCALMIDGINKDKISDMVANIIKFSLIGYTQDQCRLYNIPMRKVAAGYYWDIKRSDWISMEEELPIVEVVGKPDKIILVPKSIVRRDLFLDYEEYYNLDILSFEQARYLNAGHALVRTLKDGSKKSPYKKDIKKEIGRGKEIIVKYTSQNPELLKKYKDRKNKLFKPISNQEIIEIRGETFDSYQDIDDKIETLKNMSSGRSDAYNYHSLMLDILELLFYPHLSKPKKEEIIDSGRKKVDIVFDNDSLSGFFMSLTRKNISCDKIFFECKNYSEDVRNPEIDQVIGRLGRNTTRMGFLLCRKIEDKSKVLSSCRFQYHGNGHCVIFLDDEEIISLLKLKRNKDNEEIDKYLSSKLEQLLKVDD